MKTSLLIVLFLVSGLWGFSQSAPGQTEVQFHPHWLLQLQGGMGYTLGELECRKLVSPAIALSGGYQFNPVWGMRVGVSGWQSKGGWVTPELTYKYKYLQLNADALVNLSNGLGGYRHDRFFSSYVFGGVAYHQGFDNDEAVALNDAGIALRYLWRDKRAFVAGRMGIGFDFRLCEQLAFNLEGNANVFSDHYNSKKANNADWQFNVMAGFTFRFGKTHVKSRKEEEVPLAEIVVKDTDIPYFEPETKKEYVKPVPQTISKEIFFLLNSSVVRESEMAKVEALLNFLNEHPEKKAVIIGFADVGTGNPRYNMALSKRRAEQVAEILIGKGISKERIILIAKGDTEQPFAHAEQNRVAICIAE